MHKYLIKEYTDKSKQVNYYNDKTTHDILHIAAILLMDTGKLFIILIWATFQAHHHLM